MRPIIKVENLSKQYRIGVREAAYGTLRESIVNAVRAPLKRLRGQGDHADKGMLWALRGVEFSIPPGEIVGIIGRNGAGKSTMLKILSRITEPTTGRIELYGRVGSLLEVGTGFHHELTGRENIYLNGAILGMHRWEIDKKFDEIVNFAEIDRFVDTPVKRYSSGMHMRLAFAVAAHLEPEILIMDEVLAVGDGQFQKKCLGKMGEVAKEGRTVIFVSHNMVAVQSLCQRAIWLNSGKVAEDGPADLVVSNYLKHSFSSLSEQNWEDIRTAPGNEWVRLHSARVRPENGTPSDPITVRTPYRLEFEYWNLRPDTRLTLSMLVYTEQGIVAFNPVPYLEPEWHGRPMPAGLFRSVCYVPGDLMNDGLHRVDLLFLRDGFLILHREDDLLVFDVRDSTETRGDNHQRWPGAVRPNLKWSTECVSEIDPQY
jgi:lipopolysaccharide transport system ATP-binding protein